MSSFIGKLGEAHKQVGEAVWGKAKEGADALKTDKSSSFDSIDAFNPHADLSWNSPNYNYYREQNRQGMESAASRPTSQYDQGYASQMQDPAMQQMMALRDVAAGTTQGQGQMAALQARQQGLNAAASMAASQRGGSFGARQRMLGQQQAVIGQQGLQRANLAGAVDQQQAIAALAGLAGQTRGQAQGIEGQRAGFEQQGNLQNEQAYLNALERDMILNQNAIANRNALAALELGQYGFVQNATNRQNAALVGAGAAGLAGLGQAIWGGNDPMSTPQDPSTGSSGM